MTEPKPDTFNIFSTHLNAAHDLDVGLLRDTFLTVTEPEFHERLRNQFGFQVRTTEPSHGVPCLANSVNALDPQLASKAASRAFESRL